MLFLCIKSKQKSIVKYKSRTILGPNKEICVKPHIYHTARCIMDTKIICYVIKMKTRVCNCSTSGCFDKLCGCDAVQHKNNDSSSSVDSSVFLVRWWARFKDNETMMWIHRTNGNKASLCTKEWTRCWVSAEEITWLPPEASPESSAEY